MHFSIDISYTLTQSVAMSDTKAKIVDDVTRLLTGAGVAVQAARDEIDNVVGAHLESFLSQKGVVTRDEFDALVSLVEKLRAELDALKN